MEKSPSWEANLFSASQKFPVIFGTRKFITAFTSARYLSLSWASSILVHTPTFHFLEIHLNIILPYTPRSPKWSRSFRFPPPKPSIRLSSPPQVLHAQPISFSIWSREHYWVRSTDHKAPHYVVFSIPRFSSLLGPNILITLFSNALRLHSSRNVSDQVPHPYTTIGKVVVLYI